ncbi:winged helix-turn-helix transcriptional regulator [Ruania halotolerans]|uniref:winged helix-turn-helix transcriptional regulator n=1 Tax=Ruania halotolerans TaxID=2897773 RepID=UPI001E31B5C1|nr:helix-turn-helix domain-containing protein [Ruania halotolerans]UFU05501.1 helix-turn-helix transcriptional regulator [Ruania halotolerans]
MRSPGLPEVTDPAPASAADEKKWEAFQWDAREDCEVRQILDRIADKWSLLVIALLEEETLRFGELARKVDGISKRMLTVTLRNLERDGLIQRTIYAEVPPRVEYRLSPLGCTLIGTIQALVLWTEEHQQQIIAARAAFDAQLEARAEPTN